MDRGVSPLMIKNLLEPKPLKSRFVVRGLAVAACFACMPCMEIRTLVAPAEDTVEARHAKKTLGKTNNR